jgi:aconitate hydratase
METLVPPLSEDKAIHQELERGPNIQPLPSFEAMSAEFTSPVLLKVGDDVSTDDILPAGSRVLPFRSNIPEISKFLFNFVDDSFYKRALESKNQGSVIVGGWNYGQGSSREHAGRSKHAYLSN